MTKDEYPRSTSREALARLKGVVRADGTVSGAIFATVWAQERHIADEKVLAELLAECGLEPDRLEQSFSQTVQERYQANTAQAIEASVFSTPGYVVDGEPSQDQARLDFVKRKISAALVHHSHADIQ